MSRRVITVQWIVSFFLTSNLAFAESENPCAQLLVQHVLQSATQFKSLNDVNAYRDSSLAIALVKVPLNHLILPGAKALSLPQTSEVSVQSPLTYLIHGQLYGVVSGPQQNLPSYFRFVAEHFGTDQVEHQLLYSDRSGASQGDIKLPSQMVSLSEEATAEELIKQLKKSGTVDGVVGVLSESNLKMYFAVRHDLVKTTIEANEQALPLISEISNHGEVLKTNVLNLVENGFVQIGDFYLFSSKAFSTLRTIHADALKPVAEMSSVQADLLARLKEICLSETCAPPEPPFGGLRNTTPAKRSRSTTDSPGDKVIQFLVQHGFRPYEQSVPASLTAVAQSAGATKDDLKQLMQKLEVIGLKTHDVQNAKSRFSDYPAVKRLVAAWTTLVEVLMPLHKQNALDAYVFEEISRRLTVQGKPPKSRAAKNVAPENATPTTAEVEPTVAESNEKPEAAAAIPTLGISQLAQDQLRELSFHKSMDEALLASYTGVVIQGHLDPQLQLARDQAWTLLALNSAGGFSDDAVVLALLDESRSEIVQLMPSLDHRTEARFFSELAKVWNMQEHVAELSFLGANGTQESMEIAITGTVAAKLRFKHGIEVRGQLDTIARSYISYKVVTSTIKGQTRWHYELSASVKDDVNLVPLRLVVSDRLSPRARLVTIFPRNVDKN